VVRAIDQEIIAMKIFFRKEEPLHTMKSFLGK
jgi:hypothetical protein